MAMGDGDSDLRVYDQTQISADRNNGAKLPKPGTTYQLFPTGSGPGIEKLFGQLFLRGEIWVQ